MSLATDIVIFLAWLAATIAPAGRLAVEDAEAGTPKAQQRGVTVFPIWPVIPMLVLGGVLLLARWLGSWVETVSTVLHSILLIGATASFARNLKRAKAIERRTTEQKDGVDPRPVNRDRHG